MQTEMNYGMYLADPIKGLFILEAKEVFADGTTGEQERLGCMIIDFDDNTERGYDLFFVPKEDLAIGLGLAKDLSEIIENFYEQHTVDKLKREFAEIAKDYEQTQAAILN